jgi:hypothetical protein
MSRYAENTDVTSEKSRAEIERTLTRYGAESFMYGWKDGAAMIAFRAKDRNIRFLLPMPDKKAREFTHRRPSDEYSNTRTGAEVFAKRYEQSVRQRWRALSLCIKAKLEAVSAGITQFEEEFYAHIVLPGGRTVYEETHANVAIAYESGEMQLLLPNYSGAN